MAINEKKEAKKKLIKSIADSTTYEQLDNCRKWLDYYEREFGKNKIIRFYLNQRMLEVPQEV